MSLPIFQIKRRNKDTTLENSTGGKLNGLTEGELGYNYYDNSLWIGPYNGNISDFSILVNENHQLTNSKWTNDTTIGPQLSLYQYDSRSQKGSWLNIGAIPSASEAQSGIVTTAAQNFKGVKTFKDGLIITNAAGTSNVAKIDNSGYIEGTRLKTTSATELTSTDKIAVIKDGWIYYITPSNLITNINLAGSGLTQTGTTINHTSGIKEGTISGSSGEITYGTAINIPKITYNNTGHITGVTTTSVTIPLQTTITGNAGSANKVNKSLIVKLNSGTTEGTNLFTFNGSAEKTVNITPGAIGAAPASNSPNYLSSGTKYAASTSVGGSAINVGVTRAGKSILIIACEQVVDTESVWFGESDGITVAEMPETYCICNIKKDSNHRTLIDCYSLINGKHWINSNQTASPTNPGVWSGWKLQENVSSSHKHSVEHTPTGTIGKVSLTPSGSVASTFTGTKSSHSHGFSGTAHNHKFSGSAATSEVTPENSTNRTTIYQITGVGTLPTASLDKGTLPSVKYTAPTSDYTAPTLGHRVEKKCLILSWGAGSHTFNSGSLEFDEGTLPSLTFNSGALPTREQIIVPTAAHTHSVTAAGTIENATVTGTIGTTDITPEGSVSSTFTGTAQEHDHTFSGNKATINTSAVI